MAKGKDGKSKNKLKNEQKLYQLLTLGEVKQREQRYANHIVELRVCLNFIQDALEEVEEMDKQQLAIDKWNNYVACDELPKPYLTPNVRLFFTKLKFFENESFERSIDWLLSVNERSILSQNIFRKDLTQKTLSKILRPEFGLEYNNRIEKILKLLRRIEDYLENDNEVVKAKQNVLEEIADCKLCIFDEISKYFDNYTYRILCSEKAYMSHVDPITVEYCFSCNNFKLHIWALKRVPIRFTHISEPRLLANLHEVNIILHIPYSILKENLTLRALHFNFDHISSNAKSYSQNIIESADNLTVGIKDLPECLINEWLVQSAIQSRVRNTMIQERAEYEELLRLTNEANSKKSKKRNENEDKKKETLPKLPKLPKEPPIVRADEYPDVYKDFLEEEHNMYKNFLTTVYHPSNLELKSHEINLRKYCILGGVYQLYFVDKPTHFDFQDYNSTIHKTNKNLVIHKDCELFNNTEPTKKKSINKFSYHTSKESHFSFKIQPELIEQETGAESPWFVLTFYLPQHMCLWGEPIACHFEDAEETIELEDPTPIDIPTIQSDYKSNTSLRKKRSGVNMALESNISLTEKSTNLKANPSNYYSYLYKDNKNDEIGDLVLKTRRNSYVPNESNFFATSLSNVRLALTDTQKFVDGLHYIPDFYLSKSLTKTEIRYLERYCLPRILSSYKFPKEIKEEELQISEMSSKGKGGMLVRKHITQGEETVNKSNRLFSYDENQRNPERLFTVFSKEDAVHIAGHLEQFSGNLPYEPETFYQLIKTLNLIKKHFQYSPRKTLDLPDFKPKVDVVSHKRTVKEKTKDKHKKQSKPIKSEVAEVIRKSTISSRKSMTLQKAIINKRSSKKLPSKEESRSEGKISEKLDSLASVKSEETVHTIEESANDIELEEKKIKIITYSHWTRRYIRTSTFNKQECKFTIVTNRLGYLGFAYKRYEHFPFKSWNLKPCETDPENEIIFTLETQYVKCVLYVTASGIRGYVTEPSDKFIRNPKMYLVIKEPVTNYKDFKQRFKESNINIFAEPDASFYIENGYFSEKHLATEMHTYCCMAANCTQIKFMNSQWNRLAKRRDLVLQFVQYKDAPENVVQVHITPEDARFVDITELCSDDLDIINLQYTLTWRNIGNYSDLHSLICSVYPTTPDLRCKDSKLICCLRSLLNEIRPLSFS